MYQNYNYYPQANHQNFQQPLTFNLKGRPVSSLDEVRATTIDFDGSVFFFPDLANRRIYTKQINTDGTASLYVYELKNEAPQTPQQINFDNFVTKEEFKQAIDKILNTKPITTTTEGDKNYAF